MTDQARIRAGLAASDAKYGRRRVLKMYAQVNALRQAITAGDMVATQSAWADIEPHIDFAYQMAAGTFLPDED